MPFARTKLVIEDNCFEEEPGAISMRFIGMGVPKLYKKMYELIKSVFNVPESQIQETSHDWGRGKDKVKFSITWWLHKDLDVFSYLYIKFVLKGEGDEKTGNASVAVSPLVRSEYPQDTIWQRSLFYEMLRTFWHRVSYHRQRFDYSEECRHMVVTYQHQMQEFFKQLREKYG